jgi:imidazolonepropionase-like amidohydrolase
MTEERLIPHQTVIIRGRSIEAIGPSAELGAPTGTVLIDGHGRYLMPGLVDMHTHICDRNDLLLLVANGVTSVRNMAEHPAWARLFGYSDVLDLKAQIERGNLLGPTIYAAGPVLEGRNPVSPLFTVMKDAREAERAVREQYARGYELIKVYDRLPPDVYERILTVASELNLPVVGHVPKAVGIDRALAAGQYSIEHLTGYTDNDSSKFVIPEDRIDEYAARTAAAGIWNCPTLTIYDNLVPPSRFELFTRRVPGLWRVRT